MKRFVCSLCHTSRIFSSFSKLFRHIGFFHKNDPSFRFTCNLNASCGSLYKTYAAYKAHVYRHHSNSLQNSIVDRINQQLFHQQLFHQNSFHDSIDRDSSSSMDDDEMNHEDDLFSDHSTTFDEEKSKTDISLADIQHVYVRLLVQLREEFLLPQKIISIISSHIISLLKQLHRLIQQKSITLSEISTTLRIGGDSVVDLEVLATAIHDVSSTIEKATRSEYEFIKICKLFLNYQHPNEILLSNPGERREYGYMIPISQTISCLLNHPQILPLIKRNASQQWEAVKNDNDLMFSLRDGNYGVRIGDDSFLIQLYVDDIGLTNPIGPQRDCHKMTMVYFLLEDLPDKFRSQVQSINLLAIAPSKSLKVIPNTLSFVSNLYVH